MDAGCQVLLRQHVIPTRAWHTPDPAAMLGCSNHQTPQTHQQNNVECPKCSHQFQCCCCHHHQHQTTVTVTVTSSGCCDVATRAQKTMSGGNVVVQDVHGGSATTVKISNKDGFAGVKRTSSVESAHKRPQQNFHRHHHQNQRHATGQFPVLMETTSGAPLAKSRPNSTRSSVVVPGVIVFPASATSPQLKSPSVPIAFVMPQHNTSSSSSTASPHHHQHHHHSNNSRHHSFVLAAPLPSAMQQQVAPPPPPSPYVEGRSETDLVNLSNTVRALHRSGWYYEGIKYNRSDNLLRNAEVGTFLIRNSSDPRYLFSLSMQTQSGPKSVRLFYANGSFRLDAQAHLQHAMPQFPGVVELVEHYVRNGKNNREKFSTDWFDLDGRWQSSIYLKRPLIREGHPPCLKHLARLALNATLAKKDRTKGLLLLGLPKSLQEYIQEYPYSV